MVTDTDGCKHAQIPDTGDALALVMRHKGEVGGRKHAVMVGLLLGKHLHKANSADKESHESATLRKAHPKHVDFAFLPAGITQTFFPDLVKDIATRDKGADFSGLAEDLNDTRHIEWDVRGVYHVATSTSADAIRRIANMNPCRVPLATGIRSCKNHNKGALRRPFIAFFSQ